MHYDVAIIGAGPGGYVSAIYAAKKGAKVVLIEKDQLGGTCLNLGCIPTKALLHSANLMNKFRDAQRFGVIAENIRYSWDDVQHNMKDTIKSLSNGIKSLLQANKVDIIKGYAELVSKKTIHVKKDKGKKIITAGKIIVATGSSPLELEIPGGRLKNVITSEQALFLDKPPSSMVIVGGGAIGLEIGYLYNSLGSEIVIIEMCPEILPDGDEYISSQLNQMLASQGIKILTNSKVQEIKQNGPHLTSVVENENGIKTIDSEYVLTAIGRKPNLGAVQSIGLHKGQTYLEVDDKMRTSLDNIYAIGDVTSKHMLAHVASYQGIIAASNAMDIERLADYNAVPSCVYTSPEVASVGLTEQEATDLYTGSIKIGTFPFAASGKALTIGNSQGIVRIISDRKYNQILGVHILGPNATELIAEAVIAIKLECTADELVDTIHAHPTLSESLMEASFDLMGEPIHKM